MFISHIEVPAQAQAQRKVFDLQVHLDMVELFGSYAIQGFEALSAQSQMVVISAVKSIAALQSEPSLYRVPKSVAERFGEDAATALVIVSNSPQRAAFTRFLRRSDGYSDQNFLDYARQSVEEMVRASMH